MWTALSAAGGKHRQEWCRTSSLSVPWGLEGSGIILFIVKNAQPLAHVYTRCEEAIQFLNTPCVFQSTCQKLTHKSLHVRAHTHINNHKKFPLIPSSIYLPIYLSTWHIKQNQIPTGKDSLGWYFKLCCHFNNNNSSCDSSVATLACM